MKGDTMSITITSLIDARNTVDTSAILDGLANGHAGTMARLIDAKHGKAQAVARASRLGAAPILHYYVTEEGAKGQATMLERFPSVPTTYSTHLLVLGRMIRIYGVKGSDPLAIRFAEVKFFGTLGKLARTYVTGTDSDTFDPRALTAILDALEAGEDMSGDTFGESDSEPESEPTPETPEPASDAVTLDTVLAMLADIQGIVAAHPEINPLDVSTAASVLALNLADMAKRAA